MLSLQATTSGTTTASGSFFSAIGAPQVAMPAGRAGRAIVECNGAGLLADNNWKRLQIGTNANNKASGWCGIRPLRFDRLPPCGALASIFCVGAACTQGRQSRYGRLHERLE